MKKLFTIACAALLAGTQMFAAKYWYVKENGTGTTGNCQSWATAMGDFRACVNTAQANTSDFNIVVVAPGNYTYSTAASLTWKNLNLYGGVPVDTDVESDSWDWSAWNPDANSTVISFPSTFTPGSGTRFFTLSNTTSSTFFATNPMLEMVGFTYQGANTLGRGAFMDVGSNYNIRLRNVTIKNCIATVANSWGGVIAMNPNSGTITYKYEFIGCNFEDNKLDGISGSAYGGVLAFNTGAEALIDNCVFKNNLVISSSNVRAGAIYVGTTSNEKIVITNTLFENNKAKSTANTADAGAIQLQGCSSLLDKTVSNCVFKGNISESSTGTATAGAVGIAGVSWLNIKNCSFVENQSIGGGTGTALSSALNVSNSQGAASQPYVISNCKFENNLCKNETTPANARGAVVITSTLPASTDGVIAPVLDNCLFAFNETTGTAAALSVDSKKGNGTTATGTTDRKPMIINSTFVKNKAADGSIGGVLVAGSALFMNCVVAGNSAVATGEQIVNNGAYSIFKNIATEGAISNNSETNPDVVINGCFQFGETAKSDFKSDDFTMGNNTNYASADFTPKNTSALKEAGVATYIASWGTATSSSKDITGGSRGTLPTIGAYEYDPTTNIDSDNPIQSTPLFFNLSDETIYLSEGAISTIQVYGLSGGLALQAKGVSQLSIAGLPKGYYVAKASIEGKEYSLSILK